MLNERNTLLEDDGIEEEILVEEECSVAQAMWGDIGGNIENQTDLQNALDAKQDSLTEAQLSAVNSGITAGKVETYDGYADQIASKAGQSALNAETIARREADTALGTRIDNEALARQSADNGLQTQIDAITSKSDVVDVVANYAALQAYDTSTLGNNDVVKVLDDETHEDALTYYRWSTTTQTWSYIGQEAPYYSKGQMDVKLADKQDKLTAGANIQIQNGTISATDTTYTAGNGINLNGTEFSADTTVLATKSDLDSYYTKPETDTKLAPKLEAEVVAELPTTGTESKLYLTQKAHTTQTATGNPIEATVTEQAGQLESFQLDGDTFQQTYTGKNLFDKENYNILSCWPTSVLAHGNNWAIWIPCEPNTTYSVTKMICQPTDHNRFRIVTTAVEPNYNVAVVDAVNPGTNNTTGQITTGNTAKYLIVVLANTDTEPTTTLSEMLGSVQIEKGSTATDYEPYVGGQPSPSPEYPQPIQTVTGLQTVEVQGKNLANPTPVPGGSNGVVATYNSQTGVVTASGIAQTTWSNPFKVAGSIYLPAGTYTLKQYGELTNGRITCYARGNGYPVDASTLQRTFTTTSDGNAYICITGLTAGNSVSGTIKFQLEAGSTATQFVPYSKQTCPLDLGSLELCKLGDYQDYIYKDGDDWKVHKATGYEKKIVSLAGIDGYSSVYGTATTSNGAFSIISTNWGSDYATTAGIAIASSVIGVYQSQNIDGNNAANSMVDGSFCQRSGTNDRVYFRFASWARSKTVDEVNQMITDNGGVDLWYPLATATDTTITDTDLIAQLEAIRTASLVNGANTITNTATGTNLAGDMEIGYYGLNPTNRYDKFIWLDLNNNYEQIGGE